MEAAPVPQNGFAVDVCKTVQTYREHIECSIGTHHNGAIQIHLEQFERRFVENLKNANVPTVDHRQNNNHRGNNPRWNNRGNRSQQLPRMPNGYICIPPPPPIDFRKFPPPPPIDFRQFPLQPIVGGNGGFLPYPIVNFVAQRSSDSEVSSQIHSVSDSTETDSNQSYNAQQDTYHDPSHTVQYSSHSSQTNNAYLDPIPGHYLSPIAGMSPVQPKPQHGSIPGNYSLPITGISPVQPEPIPDHYLPPIMEVKHVQPKPQRRYIHNPYGRDKTRIWVGQQA